MKRANLLGGKPCAFRSVSPVRREALIHVAFRPSSQNAKAAMEKTPERFGPGTVFVNGNGSENMREAEECLAARGVTQYWARLKRPKDKPFAERLIGVLQGECLDYRYEPMCAGELQKVVDARLDKCHHYRPRESLGFLTLSERSAILGVPIPKRAGVL